MTRTREQVRLAVFANPVSRRYVARATQDDSRWRVFDQVEGRFVPDAELLSIDPEAKMVLR